MESFKFPFERKALEWFDCISWPESKTENNSFEKMLTNNRYEDLLS